MLHGGNNPPAFSQSACHQACLLPGRARGRSCMWLRRFVVREYPHAKAKKKPVSDQLSTARGPVRDGAGSGLPRLLVPGGPMPPSCRSCLTSNISDWTAAGRNEEAKRSQEPADGKLRHQNPAPSRTLKLLFLSRCQLQDARRVSPSVKTASLKHTGCVHLPLSGQCFFSAEIAPGQG